MRSVTCPVSTSCPGNGTGGEPVGGPAGVALDGAVGVPADGPAGVPLSPQADANIRSGTMDHKRLVNTRDLPERTIGLRSVGDAAGCSRPLAHVPRASYGAESSTYSPSVAREIL
jgi:hypothetical protein